MLGEELLPVQQAGPRVHLRATVDRCVLSLWTFVRISQARVQTQRPGSKCAEAGWPGLLMAPGSLTPTCLQQRTSRRVSGGECKETLLPWTFTGRERCHPGLFEHQLGSQWHPGFLNPRAALKQMRLPESSAVGRESRERPGHPATSSLGGTGWLGGGRHRPSPCWPSISLLTIVSLSCAPGLEKTLMPVRTKCFQTLGLRQAPDTEGA